MKGKPKKVSIIIRTLNEGRWINSCLNAVKNQIYKNFEIILIDNHSTDNTVDKAKKFDVKIIKIKDYLPGAAINLGVKNSNGEIIVCLSGHCIPKNKLWLGNLIRHLDNNKIAGIYGRQEHMDFSSNSDKRDLMIIFGEENRLQKKDTFFHNANSAFLKKTLELYPFNETVTNIEDRIWGKKIIKKGLQLLYESEASVYHYHGIHQNGNKERLSSVVRVLEEHNIIKKPKSNYSYEICAIIPVKSNEKNNFLLSQTIKRASKSRLINKCVVSTDSDNIISLAESYGLQENILRPSNLSDDFVSVDDVLKFTLKELNKKQYFPDIIVYLSILNPYRSKALIDGVIRLLIKGHYDSVIPGIKEYRSCWGNNIIDGKQLDEGFIPRNYKNPLYIGVSGLGTATFSDIILKDGRLGKKVGIYTLEDNTSLLEIRDKNGIDIAQKILKDWLNTN